jgi:hypothetical protein
MSASEVLRTASPRKYWSNPQLVGNRFNVFREPSPVPVLDPERARAGSVSQKRKNLDDGSVSGPSYASVANPEPDPMPAPGPKMVVISEDNVLEVVKIKSVCDQVATDINNTEADPAVLTILGTINDAVSRLCGVFGNLKPAQAPAPAPAPAISTPASGMVSLGNITKRPRTGNTPRSDAGLSNQVPTLSVVIPDSSPQVPP